jgi:hypothetical protein
VSQPMTDEKWLSMSSVPKNASWIRLLVRRNGTEDEVRAHWAEDLSGSDQPPFRGFFEEGGGGFVGVEGTPIGWLPAPKGEGQPTEPDFHQRAANRRAADAEYARSKSQRKPEKGDLPPLDITDEDWIEADRRLSEDDDRGPAVSSREYLAVIIRRERQLSTLYRELKGIMTQRIPLNTAFSKHDCFWKHEHRALLEKLAALIPER